MNHLVFSPIEAPAFELDLVMRVEMHGWMTSTPIPERFRKACAPNSILVLSVTPIDCPCIAEVKIRRGRFCITVKSDFLPWPNGFWVHLVGRARNSPPAWERHSRQQFMRNKRVFSMALPNAKSEP